MLLYDMCTSVSSDSQHILALTPPLNTWPQVFTVAKLSASYILKSFEKKRSFIKLILFNFSNFFSY